MLHRHLVEGGRASAHGVGLAELGDGSDAARAHGRAELARPIDDVGVSLG